MNQDIHKMKVGFGLLTVSNSRDATTDKSGELLAKRITAADHLVIAREISLDNKEQIIKIVKAMASNQSIDAIITTGGTGLTGWDVTPEAIEPLFDKRIDGFSAIFHHISFSIIGTATIQSRATAGLIGSTLVFVLPGSPGACRDAWDRILRYQFDHNHRPCNFIEIMPRFDEHLR